MTSAIPGSNGRVARRSTSTTATPSARSSPARESRSARWSASSVVPLVIARSLRPIEDAAGLQVVDDALRVHLGSRGGRVESELGVERRLVGIVDTGEIADLASARLRIPALHV